jgi:hypothetical protein
MSFRSVSLCFLCGSVFSTLERFASIPIDDPTDPVNEPYFVEVDQPGEVRIQQAQM